MNTDKLTTVLSTGKNAGREITYTLPAREAVIAAHAQSRGDYNTWDYAKKYGAEVLETALGFSLGEFWAAKPGKDATVLQSRFVRGNKKQMEMRARRAGEVRRT